MEWNVKHGNILSETLLIFQDKNIKYFILRNYEGLPNVNLSKDVDIIVEPKKSAEAINIIKSVYKGNGLSNYHEVQFGKVNCCHGIDISLGLGIHIDIISSYVSKGYEIFSFEELYLFTENYNSLRVLNKYMEGVLVFIYKQFNYNNPSLKPAYKEIIFNTHTNYPEFKKLISRFVGNKLTNEIFLEIENRNFDKMLTYSKQLTKGLRRYAFKKQRFYTCMYKLQFFWEKFNRLILSYRKYSKVFAVMGPDGSGKTTFLNALIDKIDHYYVNDKIDVRCNVYHFRPNIFPNLGEIGERTKFKVQDKDFTNPHRAKPANTLSSLFRITYYWIDYLIGFNFLVRKDVKFDRFTVFDRYSYDFLVDPIRVRLNLPMWCRKFFVKCMPHPKIVFYLNASPEVIFKRKQELTLDEIRRQRVVYKKVANSHTRFNILNANRPVIESVDDAFKILIKTFTEKL